MGFDKGKDIEQNVRVQSNVMKYAVMKTLNKILPVSFRVIE